MQHTKSGMLLYTTLPLHGTDNNKMKSPFVFFLASLGLNPSSSHGIPFTSNNAAATSSSDSTIQLDLVPYPKEVTIGKNFLRLIPQEFDLEIQSCFSGSDCDILQEALQRYHKLFFPSIGSTEMIYRLSIFEDRINAPVPNDSTHQLMKLNVVVTSKVLGNLLKILSSHVISLPPCC
jgi:hypothetical protein